MSGRLIILPKKTYCPWNPSNVARVLRDEEENAKAQKKAAARREQESSRDRLESLHRNLKRRNHERQSDDTVENRSREENSDGQRTQKLEHVNLFAAEEKERNQRLAEATKRERKDERKQTNALYLGQSAKKLEDAFYIRQPHTRGSLSRFDRDDADKETATQEYERQKEERLKNRMDPMKAFMKGNDGRAYSRDLNRVPSLENGLAKSQTPELGSVSRTKNLEHRESIRSKREDNEGSSSESDSSNSASRSSSSESSAEARRQRKKRRKRRERRRRRSKSSSDERLRQKRRKGDRKTTSTLDELRKRRALREEAEQKRQETLVSQNNESTPRGTYHNQYFPRFSRK